MKKSFLMLMAIFMSLIINAQEVAKQKEIGIVFKGYSNYGFVFKTGNEKSLWRYNAILFQGNNSNETSDSALQRMNANGYGLSVGKEYKKPIEDKFEFVWGIDLSFSYTYTMTERDDKSVKFNDYSYEHTLFSPGINLVFGLNYLFDDKVNIGIELNPEFNYVFGTTIRKNDSYYSDSEETKINISRTNYNISNTAKLTLAYRF